jgi:NAD(P)-dependent dehydrogenase (short-subunit alcohol dehydrogenase family)
VATPASVSNSSISCTPIPHTLPLNSSTNTPSYAKNATIYIAGRSPSKAEQAIKLIFTTAPFSTGKLEFLLLDLADLSTIAKSVKEFLAKERRLDVLWNNAGVMRPPAGSKTVQVSVLASVEVGF